MLVKVKEYERENAKLFKEILKFNPTQNCFMHRHTCIYIYSTDKRQGISRLRFDHGCTSYEPRSKRGETRRNGGLNEALPRYKRITTTV